MFFLPCLPVRFHIHFHNQIQKSSSNKYKYLLNIQFLKFASAEHEQNLCKVLNR